MQLGFGIALFQEQEAAADASAGSYLPLRSSSAFFAFCFFHRALAWELADRGSCCCAGVLPQTNGIQAVPVEWVSDMQAPSQEQLLLQFRQQQAAGGVPQEVTQRGGDGAGDDSDQEPDAASPMSGQLHRD